MVGMQGTSNSCNMEIKWLTPLLFLESYEVKGMLMLQLSSPRPDTRISISESAWASPKTLHI